jgi:hypothetical protein
MLRAKRSALAVILASAFASGYAAPALAQSPDPSTRKAARILAEEGLALFDRKEYAAALEKFDQADAILSAPTVDLFAARCLAALGRLVAAEARYRDVAAAPIEEDAPRAFRDAVAEGERERSALLPRIPSIAIAVKGGRGEVVVLLDDKEVPPAALREPRRVDPGDHKVEARSGADSAVKELSLKEGERASVELALPVPPPPRPEPPPQPPPVDTGRTQRALGGISMALGAAGMAVWGVTGALALRENGALTEQGCAEGRCPHGTETGSYRALRTTSTVGFWAGVGGLALGTVLLLTAPGPEQPRRGATMAVWVVAVPPAAAGAADAGRSVAAAVSGAPLLVGLKGAF